MNDNGGDKRPDIVVIKCKDCGKSDAYPNAQIKGSQFTAEEVFTSGVKNYLLKCPSCGGKNLEVETQ